MFNFFKDFFGSSGSNDPPRDFNNRRHFLKEEDDFSEGFFGDHDEQKGFNVFTNPLEMHRYFESQLNSMLKSFGLPSDGMFFGLNENGPDAFSNFLEGPQEQHPNDSNLRDQYLKPGFQQPHSKIEDKSDRDLDGKINTADLDDVFSNKNKALEPYTEKPKIRSFGKSVMKTFTFNNGIIESRETVRDGEGNEETKVTHKRGDQEYTKITKIDRDGRQEIKENFLNMTPDDLEKFMGNKNMITDSDPATNEKHPNWFPFDKYFK